MKSAKLDLYCKLGNYLEFKVSTVLLLLLSLLLLLQRKGVFVYLQVKLTPLSWLSVTRVCPIPV